MSMLRELLFTGLVSLLFISNACLPDTYTLERQFKEADAIRTSDMQRFFLLLDLIEEQNKDFTPYQQDLFKYLKGYSKSIRGFYTDEIPTYKALLETSKFPDIKYRAAYSLATNYGVLRDFYLGATYLNRMDSLQDQVIDTTILNSGKITKSLFYQEAEQYELAIQVALELMRSPLKPRSECIVRGALVESKYHSELTSLEIDFVNESESFCLDINEAFLSSFISITKAKLLTEQGRFSDAQDTLKRIEQTVLKSNYPRSVAMYYTTAADTLFKQGDIQSAAINAQNALQFSAQAEYNKPAVSAYLTLSKVAKLNNNFEQALMYHELYVEADSAYVTERQTNQLAFQRARFESELKEQALSLVTKENELLAAEAAAAKEQARNSLLINIYSVIALSVVFVWLYRALQVKRKFKRLAETDGLTGLLNRREFTRTANQALATCKKNKLPISFVILDLDHFKRINDTHGHAVGDIVLKLVSGVLKRECRDSDIVARLGGEEFAVILPSCNGNKALEIANTLREKIASIDTSEISAELTVTASFGVADNVEGSENYEILFTRSDTALYRSKSEGRNRVYLADVAHC